VPYTKIKKELVDGKEKWCFRNKETGDRYCSDTRKKAVTHMRLKYHVEAGGEVTESKK